MGLIYIATSPSGKSYIGYTSHTLAARKASHYSESKNLKRKSYFHQAINKYGKENITWSVVEDNILNELLPIKEINYIKQYNTLAPSGYNQSPGGEVSPALLPEVRKKISESRKAKNLTTWNKGIKTGPLSSAHRDKISIAVKLALSNPIIREKMRGRKLTQEQKDALSKSLKGRKSPMKGKQGTFLGKKHTEEAKLKMRKSRRGKLTWETVNQIRQEFIENKTTQKYLADKFNISAGYISTILNNKQWINSNEKFSFSI